MRPAPRCGRWGAGGEIARAGRAAHVRGVVLLRYGDIKFVVSLMDVEASKGTHNAQGMIPGSPLDLAVAGVGGDMELTAESQILSASQDSWVDTPSITNISRTAPTPSVPRPVPGGAAPGSVGAARGVMDAGVPRRSPPANAGSGGGVAGAGASWGASDWKRRHTPARQGQLPLRRCASVSKATLPGAGVGSAARRPVRWCRALPVWWCPRSSSCASS